MRSDKIKHQQMKRKEYRVSTEFLTLSLPVIGILIFFAIMILLRIILRGNMPEKLFLLLTEIPLLSLIISAVSSIIRREITRIGLPSIEGGWAILFGSFQAVVWIIAELYLLFLLFKQ